jgi:drug/metabolite transporter (DMT)-like permease
MGPLFIPIIEWAVLRNKVGISTWVGVVVSFIGLIFVLQPDEGIFSFLSLIGLLSGLSQGASQVVFGINSKAERGDLGVLYLFLLVSIISLIPYLFIHSTWVPGQEWSHWIILLLLFIGISSTCNQMARAVAYQHGTPSRLSSFLYFSIVLAAFLDWAIYDKIPNELSIIGACLVILGGLLKIYLRAQILKNKA